jgi:hypothetical protein
VLQQASLLAAALSPAKAGANKPGAKAKTKAAANSIINSFFMTIILILKCKSTSDAVLDRYCYRNCFSLNKTIQPAF